jgi:hypothetical protein
MRSQLFGSALAGVLFVAVAVTSPARAQMAMPGPGYYSNAPSGYRVVVNEPIMGVYQSYLGVQPPAYAYPPSFLSYRPVPAYSYSYPYPARPAYQVRRGLFGGTRYYPAR